MLWPDGSTASRHPTLSGHNNSTQTKLHSVVENHDRSSTDKEDRWTTQVARSQIRNCTEMASINNDPLKQHRARASLLQERTVSSNFSLLSPSVKEESVHATTNQSAQMQL
eukprot:m.493151 g.493151  ORF g.493151 m.493151 type:complete len:111 (+) comp118282_c0_seq1:82-414(+)